MGAISRSLRQAFFAYAAISICHLGEVSANDVSYGARIVGTWVPAEMDRRAATPILTIYRNDGSFELILYADRTCSQIRLRATGLWSIRDEVLTTRTTSNSDPSSPLQPGLVIADKILRLTDEEMTLLGSQGTVQFRVKREVCNTNSTRRQHRNKFAALE